MTTLMLDAIHSFVICERVVKCSRRYVAIFIISNHPLPMSNLTIVTRIVCQVARSPASGNEDQIRSYDLPSSMTVVDHR